MRASFSTCRTAGQVPDAISARPVLQKEPSLLREASLNQCRIEADAIVFKSSTRDWNDEHCERLLQNFHNALKKRDRLTVIDRVLPEHLEPKPEHLSAVMSDLNTLREPGETRTD